MKPVVALDIDGTLGDYHGHFLRFAQDWYGRPMPLAEDNPGLPLHKFMKTSKSTYRRCKLAYRQGGLKRSMPVYGGASELTRHIRKHAEIWICTTRPYLSHNNIEPDTMEWLRRNRIQYDGVLYGQHKYAQLIQEVGLERVLLVVDDLAELVVDARRRGLLAVIRDQPYNRFWEHGARVYSMEEIQYLFDAQMDKWRRNH
jgi:5'(3')-deoxyribonucleotidase